MSSVFNATTKEGRARIRSDMHQMTWPLGGSPFTNGQGIERLLDACKALEKGIAARDARIAALEAQIARLTAVVRDVHDCARYDALMSGPVFMGWDRSALNRLQPTLRAIALEGETQ